ncbi:helix-turn-helix domain-containing protein [Aestuariivita sp.]|uniref:helix-turn-helix domain-containing protein n=1 Tax=Aestuariivita sp. TaxID=1872407 RepID=UPI0025BC81B8|nr:helix-turn-helix domain-containing protein [Aestuariivita sp.]
MTHHNSHIERVTARALSPSAVARSSIAASWFRSMVRYGLDPGNQKRLHRLDGSDLEDIRQENGTFRFVAETELDRLFQLVGAAGCGLYLTDRTGVVIDHRCKSEDETFFRAIGLEPGALCSEEVEGTNGMGTSLAELRPVIIDRDEHFFARSTGLTCIGAPVFGSEGEVIGALDISTVRADQTSAANLLLVDALVQCARRIETAYFRLRHPGARIMVADVTQADGTALLAVDPDDLVIGATRAARLAFDLGLDGPIAAQPAADLLGTPGAGRDIAQIQRSAILRALSRSSGNVSAAARQLGIGRATLYRRMKDLGIAN